MDDGNSETARLGRLGDLDQMVVYQDGSLVGRDHSGDDLDECRLAGAVRSEQSVDLAGPELELDAVQRLGAAVALRHSMDFEACRCGEEVTGWHASRGHVRGCPNNF